MELHDTIASKGFTSAIGIDTRNVRGVIRFLTDIYSVTCSDRSGSINRWFFDAYFQRKNRRRLLMVRMSA